MLVCFKKSALVRLNKINSCLRVTANLSSGGTDALITVFWYVILGLIMDDSSQKLLQVILK